MTNESCCRCLVTRLDSLFRSRCSSAWICPPHTQRRQFNLYRNQVIKPLRTLTLRRPSRQTEGMAHFDSNYGINQSWYVCRVATPPPTPSRSSFSSEASDLPGVIKPLSVNLWWGSHLSAGFELESTASAQDFCLIYLEAGVAGRAYSGGDMDWRRLFKSFPPSPALAAAEVGWVKLLMN